MKIFSCNIRGFGGSVKKSFFYPNSLKKQVLMQDREVCYFLCFKECGAIWLCRIDTVLIIKVWEAGLGFVCGLGRFRSLWAGGLR